MDNVSNNEGVEKARAAVEAHLKQGPVEVVSAATQVVAGECVGAGRDWSASGSQARWAGRLHRSPELQLSLWIRALGQLRPWVPYCLRNAALQQLSAFPATRIKGLESCLKPGEGGPVF